METTIHATGITIITNLGFENHFMRNQTPRNVQTPMGPKHEPQNSSNGTSAGKPRGKQTLNRGNMGTYDV